MAVRGTTLVGPLTGNWVLVDPATGAVTPLPGAIRGEVRAAEPDGSGGWFVGGDFGYVGADRVAGVAHLAADGSLISILGVTVYTVTTLAVDGDTVYVGGPGRLTAYSAATGAALPFRPTGYGHSDIEAIQPVPATAGRPARVIVASGFRDDGGRSSRAPARRLRALDPVTGADVAGFSSDLYGVRALALDGDRLYAGGDGGVVALDAGTGVVDPTFAPGDAAGFVSALALGAGRVFAAGRFESLGGAAGPLVALDPETGDADPGFDPPLQPREEVDGLSFADGDLWATGRRSISGEARGSVRRLDPATGAARPTPLPTFNRVVDVARVSGDGLFVGGLFWTTGETATPGGLVTLDADTFDVLATGDGHLDTAGDLLGSATALFVAPTHFHTAPDGDDVLALEPRTGAVLAAQTLRNVARLTGVAVTSSRVYVAQRTGSAASRTNRVTVYDARTGHRVRSFVVPVRGRIYQLVAAPGALYLAGRFDTGGPHAFHSEVLKLAPSGRLRRGFHTDLASSVHAKGADLATDLAVGDGRLFVTVQRSDDFVGALVAVRGSDGKKIAPFEARQPCFVVDQCRATVIGDRLFDFEFGASVLDTRTGAPVAGADPYTYAVVQTPGGVVRADVVDLYVGGGAQSEETFVARSDR